ncbi:MAG: twin-arginine translocase TatA/TatE family subunit [Paludibacteraceae bacterium]|jgi:sec-independent protein translocase protein TatA|nr:twin-arginine translocase TatA/TatE family subunit [Paludibacteraceae bacterium]MBP3716761.1 twin-arginine translocase TatA/TatE family subunit [Paludibacteraceae bacterium]MBQ4036146.1 twin-arginine translocase TatA/TatE family subunit [Paludibacteraceae bacterium]MBR6041307.1 twin-arginine translocase TatA/TatE family subunit [Paludibacteraceae bacterium]MBR6103957.1 twin-arginine translocase TatA/TatE family subunit [Paludibacteraceae bacterium]
MFGLGFPELLLIVFVVLLLFGGKRIPELMKSLGKGVSSFKEGMKDVTNTDTEDKKEERKD